MGCFTFVKVMMVAFNLLIFVAGLALQAIGIWFTVDGGFFLKIVGPFSTDISHVVNVGYFCLALGGVMPVLAVLGCCGARNESKCLLIMFFSIILIIFVAEAAAGVVALAYSSVAEGVLKPWATAALRTDYGRDAVVTGVWNGTMTELKCCGVSGYTDFTDSHYFNSTSQGYPASCCAGLVGPDCNQADAQTSAIKGCMTQLLSSVQMNANIIGGVALAVCGVELAAMALSMYLYFHLENNDS